MGGQIPSNERLNWKEERQKDVSYELFDYNSQCVGFCETVKKIMHCL